MSFSLGINVLYMVQENLRLKPFLKVLLFIFLWGTKSMCYFSISDCYIKMSWHMCLKCKIYKKEKKIHLMLMIFYFTLSSWYKKLSFFFYSWLSLYVIYLQMHMENAFLSTWVGEEAEQSFSRQSCLQVCGFLKLIFLPLLLVGDTWFYAWSLAF